MIAGLADALQRSKLFQVNILDVVDAGTAVRGIFTVYRCRINAIDGTPVHKCPALHEAVR